MSEGDSVDLKSFNSVLVYCRVRSIDVGDGASNVLIKSQTSVSLTNSTCNQRKETLYTFRRVFGPQSNQNDVYKTVAQPLVEKLLVGSSGLLFTYGVTGSGKTYTMMGTPEDLGLMPRCLDALFRTIAGCHARKSIFQSDHLNGFEIVSEAEAIAKQKAERRAYLNQKSAPRSKSTEQIFNLSSLRDTSHVPGIDERNVYAIFISYIEIYNNNVYDLLEESSLQKIPQSRMVREDANHNMYVHGVTEIEIRSVNEGMETFSLGQKRKKIGHTVLNAESSRSHAVFNIRLVQARIGHHERDDKRTITISQLSLIDLAGSERSSRTKITGARLREAGNINNSLMTLRTCLEYLRENQQALPGATSKKIPYRDSKITQLFKNFFEGEGQVSMITCINPRIEDHLENSHVMRFAETTQDIQVPCATTVQLTNSDNDVIRLLRTKFGCDIECSVGDGPLSEKLCNLFEQQMRRYQNAEALMHKEVQKYRSKVFELEQRNRDLNATVNKHEDTIHFQKITIEELRHDLARRIDSANKNGFKSKYPFKNGFKQPKSTQNDGRKSVWPHPNLYGIHESERSCIQTLGDQPWAPRTLMSAMVLQRSRSVSDVSNAGGGKPTAEQRCDVIRRLTNANTMNTSNRLTTSISCSNVNLRKILEFE